MKPAEKRTTQPPAEKTQRKELIGCVKGTGEFCILYLVQQFERT